MLTFCITQRLFYFFAWIEVKLGYDCVYTVFYWHTVVQGITDCTLKTYVSPAHTVLFRNTADFEFDTAHIQGFICHMPSCTWTIQLAAK